MPLFLSTIPYPIRIIPIKINKKENEPLIFIEVEVTEKFSSGTSKKDKISADNKEIPPKILKKTTFIHNAPPLLLKL